MKSADMNFIEKVLIRDERRGAPNEAKKGYAYLNSEGIPMIGIGRNLKTRGLSFRDILGVLRSLNLRDDINLEDITCSGICFDNLRSWQDFTNNKSLSDKIISELLERDIDIAYYRAKKKMGNVRNLNFLPGYAQEVLIQIIFTLDAYRFNEFEKVIEAFKVNYLQIPVFAAFKANNLKIAADEAFKVNNLQIAADEAFKVNNLQIAADEILKAMTRESVYSKTFRRLDKNRFHRYANVLRTGNKREYQLD